LAAQTACCTLLKIYKSLQNSRSCRAHPLGMQNDVRLSDSFVSGDKNARHSRHASPTTLEAAQTEDTLAQSGQRCPQPEKEGTPAAT